jgi:hypothetical protein
VTRAELQAAAEREGIKPNAFSLDGWHADETYVLCIEDGGWSVYFAERGRRIDESRFETEDEACDELLLRLSRDQTTRSC